MTNFKTSTQEDASFLVMRLSQVNSDLTQRELAKNLGLIVGSINYCLQSLMNKGFLRMPLTSRFLERMIQECDALKVEIEALSAELPAEASSILNESPQSRQIL